jgi:ABC-type microcin C transport system permease subunit YejE
MKNVRMGMASLMLILCLMVGSNVAKAQVTTSPAVNNLLGSLSLVTVQTGNIVTIGSVNVPITDVRVVDVKNVLNNADIKILNDALNNNAVLNNSLNNLLQGANIIKDNQVVVGVVAAVLGQAAQFIVAKAPKK